MPQASPGRTAIYRLYDAGDVLLYLGITDNLERRYKQHAKDKFWWHLVTRKQVEWRETRREAEQEEGAATGREKPVHDRTWRMAKGREFLAQNPPPADPFRGPLTDRLRDGVLSGTYPEGYVFVVSPESANALGVSASSLSLALGTLSYEGLVHQGPIKYESRSRSKTYVVGSRTDTSSDDQRWGGWW